MKSAKWYFDFVSPFAYLQNLRLDEFSTHLKIDRKPLLFAGLLKHWDSKGPAELPPKRLFTYRHVQWMADRLDIPLYFPERHPFNPIPMLRLCIAAGCSKRPWIQFLNVSGKKDLWVMILTTGTLSVVQLGFLSLKLMS